MNSVQKQAPQMTLVFGRHIVGMAFITLINPLLYADPSTFFTAWLMVWAFAVCFSSIIFGIYALYFTERAKSTWPRSFFKLAWSLVALIAIFGWWLHYTNTSEVTQAPWLDFPASSDGVTKPQTPNPQ